MGAFCLLFLIAASGSRSWGQSFHFTLSTDIFELLDEDIQGEFSYITSFRSSFAFRLGYYRTIEDSDEKYPGDTRRWELGGRWRQFLMDVAPNLLFIGIGFDNRPKDNTITPLGEIGFNFAYKPLIVSAVLFWGYQINFNDSDANRTVKGIEFRAGLAF